MVNINGRDDVKRLSFEKVRENQGKLRKKLDELVEKGRPIEDEDEKKKFIDMLEWACLGLDGEEQFEVEVNGSIYQIGSVGLFVRYLLYAEDETVELPDFPEAPSAVRGVEKDIKQIWKAVRYELFSVFPKALKSSFNKSPENRDREGPSTKDW